MSSFLSRTKLLLWDQSPGDKEVVVAYDGDSLHTFLLDLDNVAGASVPALGKGPFFKTVLGIRIRRIRPCFWAIRIH
jgi:hypothetical protein